MRWIVAEHLLKGAFLGLLAYAALAMPTPAAAGIVAACMTGGLAVGLLTGAVRSPVRPGGNATAYALFLLLEYPRPVYFGTLGGLALGVALAGGLPASPALLGVTLAAGVGIGAATLALKTVRHRGARVGLVVAAAAALVAGGLLALDHWPEVAPEAHRRAAGLYLLLGLPFFYLLTFVGETEETEVEVGLWCAAIAVGVWLVKASPGLPALAFLIPVTLFFVYTTRVLPGLRVFKHTLRGISYGRVGLPVDALRALGRAVQLDPQNALARTALWDVHRRLDPAAVDDRLLGYVEPDLCLNRVERLLNQPPTAEQADEARRLLDLVARKGPGWLDRVRYWRAVAATHAGDIGAAAAHLMPLLQPGARDFAAWFLALATHPALEKRAGRAALAQPGGRLAAIDAVEAALLAEPERADAWTLKRLVYADLTAAEFQAGPVGEFDAGYVEQLGRALLPDASRVRRGVELLGIAAAHRPADAPQLLKAAADALQHHGDRAGAAEVRRAARRAGQAVGAAQLPDASRRDHFATVKALAEDALARGDWAEAADCLREFADSDQSGIETLRTLAQCHEKLGDPLAALAATTRGLIYNPKDADLLERRDRYTYSVAPAALRAASEGQRSAVDADYCVAKAKELLDLRDADGELLAWARHLAELATVARPDAVTPRVLLARACARLGERDESLRLLEDVREQKPARFATSADEEAWMLAQRLLGDAYLNEVGRPDLAIACFLDYRKSHKSGADTMYKLGMAYEKLGDARKAAHFYEQAAAYDGHPLAAEAQAALRRVKS